MVVLNTFKQGEPTFASSTEKLSRIDNIAAPVNLRQSGALWCVDQGWDNIAAGMSVRGKRGRGERWCHDLWPQPVSVRWHPMSSSWNDDASML